MAIETITGKTNSPISIKTPPKTGIESEQKVAITTTNTEKSDSVAFTPATQHMQQALGSSSPAPVDINRVNAIKKALADGSYQVDGEQVAKKLIQSEQLMQQLNSPAP